MIQRFVTIIALALCVNLIKNAFAENINLGIEITEIMYDSPVNDSGGEWLEFYNGTGETINLDGFLLSIGEEIETLSQREGWGDIRDIPVGAYVVITEPASKVSFDGLYGPPSVSIFVAVTKTAITLSNSEGEPIRLQNSDASVTFQDFVYPDNAKDAPVVKVSLDADEDNEASWLEASEPLGTPGSGKDASLPVAFSSITAVKTEAGVQIQWVTQTEVNNLGFNVLRSKNPDGPSEVITPQLISGAGSSAMPLNYTFLDENVDLKTISFYRIQSVDIFGSKQTSSMVRVSSYSTVCPKLRTLTTWALLKKR
jgi:hypothetical protein